MNLQNQTISNQNIIIDDVNIFNTIGQGVLIENSTLDIRVPAKSLSINGKIINSSIISLNPLKNFSWTGVTIENCKFDGLFKDNKFGDFKNENSNFTKSCDFSKADLNGCQFYGAFAETHNYPSWPNFTILDPHKNLKEMLEKTKSENLLDIIYSIELFDKSLQARSLNSQFLSKFLGENEENIKAFFKQFPFVV